MSTETSKEIRSAEWGRPLLLAMLEKQRLQQGFVAAVVAESQTWTLADAAQIVTDGDVLRCATFRQLIEVCRRVQRLGTMYADSEGIPWHATVETEWLVVFAAAEARMQALKMAALTTPVEE